MLAAFISAALAAGGLAAFMYFVVYGYLRDTLGNDHDVGPLGGRVSLVMGMTTVLALLLALVPTLRHDPQVPRRLTRASRPLAAPLSTFGTGSTFLDRENVDPVPKVVRTAATRRPARGDTRGGRRADQTLNLRRRVTRVTSHDPSRRTLPRIRGT